MNRTPVQSSTVESVGYDPTSMTLEVSFKSGGVYQYFDVPETIYQEMLRAESIGSFLAQQVKGSYRYAKV